MEAFLAAIVTGIISGIVSAAIFHCLLQQNVPEIKISDKISKRDVNGKTEYRIKVVNLKKRYVTNIRPYLELVHQEYTSTGIVARTKILPIYADDIPYIDPYDENDTVYKYAVRCELTDTLEADWNDNLKYLQVKIFCEDAFSGAGKLFCQTYQNPNTCIVPGKFKAGMSMEIEP